MTPTLETIERDKLHASFRELLGVEAGRRVIYWMLAQSGMYESAFTGEAASTNFILGRQEIGRRLTGEIDAIDPRFYPQLLIDIAELRDRDRAAAEAMDNPENDDDDDAP